MDWMSSFRPTSMSLRLLVHGVLACCIAGASARALGAEDIEFVAEHLPEVAMDNRYATLPVWSTLDEDAWTLSAQAAVSRASTGELRIEGPMFALAAQRKLDSRWRLGATVFMDRLSLRGSNDYRALQTLFAPDNPLQRPAAARFDGLDGTMDHLGGSLHLERYSSDGWLGPHGWVVGIVLEEIELRDYALDYEILEGPDAGTRGTIDFDATYRHLTPIIGLEVPRRHSIWSYDVTALLAWPMPRRGFVGHVTGPGFDIHGDTEDVGAGKHFGDPSVTLGFDVIYEPAHLAVGVGTLLTQRLLEPHIHRGIEANWVLNVRLSY